MKKAVLLLSFFSLSFLADAQSRQIEELKKELNSHKKEDTFRVNRLNELATISFLAAPEREKYANEALFISTKINYSSGKGLAYALLGTLKFNQGNKSESQLMYQYADSIAKKTGDWDLHATVLWRKATSVQDKREKEIMLLKADSISKKVGNVFLQIQVLLTRAGDQTDIKKRETIFFKSDSIAERAGLLDAQAYALITWANYTTDINEMEMRFRKADSIAKKIGNYELQARAQYYLGNKFITTNYKKGLLHFSKAEEIAENSGNKILLSRYQSNIGNFFLSILSDYAKAMEYYLKALRSAEQVNDTVSLIYCWSNLAAVYSYLGDHSNALTFLRKAEEANNKLGDNVAEYNLQNSIGESYRLMGKYPEAITAYNKAIELYQSVNGSDYFDESNLADVYTRMDSLPLAFKYAFKSLKEAQRLQNIPNKSWIEGILSRAYLKKNMADSAIYYGELGLKGAKETGTIEFMRDNALALANAYAFKKNFEKAYANRLLYANYQDSMTNEEVRNRTAVQQYNFNLDKKEAQISILNEQKKGQRNMLIGAMILLLLILATTALLLRNNRLKQKANRLLKKQKQEIDDKAHELSVQKDNLEKSYRNIELMGEIGRKITSSLSVETIISTVYVNVNTLMDAAVFGIGIYNENTKALDFPATYEKDQPLPFYSNSIDDESRFAPLCFNTGKEIIMGNLDEEHIDYIQTVATPFAGEQPVSMIYLPLIAKEKKLGVITIQSFQKNAYSENHLFMLRNIAIYAAIAIENAEAYEELNQTFESLKQTQKQLIQSEKMASLGELTAGIAHEIQNPLNFVNNFSDVNEELIDELQMEIKSGNIEEALALSNDIKENEQKINHHGKRADSIVKGMLQHSRISSGQKEPTDINALSDEYLRLSYHGLRAKDKSFNAIMKTDFDKAIGKVDIISQDLGRVILNLLTNAFYAVKEKKQQNSNGYEPTVTIKTRKIGSAVEIQISDNGNGISQKVLDKIYQPFFTTKPPGEGTGLGLSMSFDIVTNSHGGKLEVDTIENEGTTFTIILPI